ncbi:MAG: hypothetical protein WAN10_08395 [Candidatus Acidiferrales bacterium]
MEAFQRLSIATEVFRQELQRHKPPEFCVFGLVDHTHPAAAEFLDDSVVADCFANKRLRIGHSRILGCGVEQVNAAKSAEEDGLPRASGPKSETRARNMPS